MLNRVVSRFCLLKLAWVFAVPGNPMVRTDINSHVQEVFPLAHLSPSHLIVQDLK